MKTKLLILQVTMILSTVSFSQDVDSLLKIGYKLQNSNKYQEAIDLYNQILQNSESDANALYQKALCFMRLHQADKALPVFMKLIDNRPDFIGGAYGAATACVALKKWDKGLDYINIAIEMEKENAEYYLIRGQIYLGLNEKKKACSDFKKAKKLGSFDAKLTLKINC